MKKVVPYVALYLLTQGCVGVGALKTRTETVRDPVVPDSAGPALYSRDMSKTTNAVLYTSAWLEAHWGKPATVAPVGAGDLDEIWTYRFRPIWEGIMPIVVIPIPIALPVGREKVRFVLRDGRVINATQSRRQTVGGAVGFGFGPCGAAAGAFSLEGLFE